MIETTGDSQNKCRGRPFEKMNNWLGRSNFRQKALVLFLVTVIVYGAGIAYVWNCTDTSDSDFDVYQYQDRTQTILDGDLLYRDAHTETPPLINFVMVPAQVFGGADYPWVYAIEESFFAFLMALLMYAWFRGYDEKKAFLIGFFVLLCPYMVDKTIVCDDDSIVAFFFILGAVSMLFERPRVTAATIAVGIWTKMWTILLLPIQFLRLRTWKDRFETIAIVGIVTAIVALPFLCLCCDEFWDFLSYYFLLKANRTIEGFSMSHFLERGGLELPGGMMLVIVLISLLAAILYSRYRGWGAWKSATFIMVVFLIVYPKMHMGYYIMPMALLMVWAVEDWRILVRLFASFIPLHYAAACQTYNSKFFSDLVGESNLWVIGFFMALIGTLLFVDAMRLAFKKDTFNERAGARTPDQ